MDDHLNPKYGSSSTFPLMECINIISNKHRNKKELRYLQFCHSIPKPWQLRYFCTNGGRKEAPSRTPIRSIYNKITVKIQ